MPVLGNHFKRTLIQDPWESIVIVSTTRILPMTISMWLLLMVSAVSDAVRPASMYGKMQADAITGGYFQKNVRQGYLWEHKTRFPNQDLDLSCCCWCLDFRVQCDPHARMEKYKHMLDLSTIPKGDWCKDTFVSTT